MFPGQGRPTFNNHIQSLQIQNGAQGYNRPGMAPPVNNNSQQNQTAPPPYMEINKPFNHQSVFSQAGSVSFPPQNTQYIDPSSCQISYQYSQCTGRKKALLIGINYFGTESELKGCINDVQNMFNFLTSRYGYKAQDIVVLTDDQHDDVRIPTRANIIRAMHWLVKNAQPNDALFLHFSGHGGQIRDLDGDEEDGMDDVIYPVDFRRAGNIVDDEMHDILVKPLGPGIRLTALFDSCHSGTVLDLPYTYSTKGLIKEPNIWKNLGSNGLQAAMDYTSGNVMGMLHSVSSAFRNITQKASGNVDKELVRRYKFSPADVIMFSGSKDNQTSADAVENGASTGAMSFAFLKVLSQQPQTSYLSLLQNMRRELSYKYSQKPQLSSSHPIDVNLQFIL